jgi:hypothetical protein
MQEHQELMIEGIDPDNFDDLRVVIGDGDGAKEYCLGGSTAPLQLWLRWSGVMLTAMPDPQAVPLRCLCSKCAHHSTRFHRVRVPLCSSCTASPASKHHNGTIHSATLGKPRLALPHAHASQMAGVAPVAVPSALQETLPLTQSTKVSVRRNPALTCLVTTRTVRHHRAATVIARNRSNDVHPQPRPARRSSCRAAVRNIPLTWGLPSHAFLQWGAHFRTDAGLNRTLAAAGPCPAAARACRSRVDAGRKNGLGVSSGCVAVCGIGRRAQATLHAPSSP